MIEFILFYLTMLGGAVGVILAVLAVAIVLRFLYRTIENRFSEDWAIGVNVVIVFLLIVLLFSIAFFVGGGQQ